MKQPFLEVLAAAVDDAPADPADITVVLPTKRAGVHLRRIFAERDDQTLILPRILTIDRWIYEVAGLEGADALKTLFTGYDSYREVLGSTAQDISEFMSWAPVLLGDFNDIDSGLISPKDLFRDLVDYTEIEHFSFLDSPLSDKQENYRRFWKALPNIHAKLVEKLTAEGLAYPGLAARRAVSDLPSYLESRPQEHFLFAGLNALTRAEEKLVRELEAAGRGRILFEADGYYMDRQNHHAGLFLRRYEKSGLGRMVYTPRPLHERPIDVRVTAASDKLDQANAVADLLSQSEEYALEDTAVILADESMVVPLLQRLPPHVDAVNVTMGIPLSNGSFADWLEHWFDLHESARHTDNEGYLLQKRSCAAFVNHPFSQRLFPSTDIRWTQSYLPVKAITDTSDHPIFRAALTPPMDGDRPNLAASDRVMQMIYDKAVDMKSPGLEWRMAALGAKRVRDSIARLGEFDMAAHLNLRALRSVYTRAIRSGSLALIGEPLAGLQIMGVLEARALGFKRVILCSADEDSLPGQRTTDSFIPMEVRTHHGMPGRREKESIFAYQFHRLLQHAERFDAVYHTDAEDFTGGEKSRYLLQIEYELARRNPQVRMREYVTDPGVSDVSAPEAMVEKDPDTVEDITAYLENRGLSASAINRYLASPLEWYYSYVLNLAEPEMDELSPAEFGTIVHAVLENLYEPVIGRVITLDDLAAMDQRVENTLKLECARIAPRRRFDRGIDHIHFGTAKRMVKRFLKLERDAVADGEIITYVQSEKLLQHHLKVPHGGRTLTIPIKGYADRIERRGDQLFIIDYKTGNVKSSDLACRQIDDMEYMAGKPMALQLLLYEWMAARTYPDSKIRSRIISLPALGRTDLYLKTSLDEEAVEKLLVEIVREMLDPKTPIVANPDYQYATFE